MPRGNVSLVDPRGQRRVSHAEQWHAAARHERTDVNAGAGITGRAVVDQADTTIWLPPGWSARADEIGCLHLAPARGALGKRLAD